MSEDHSDHRAGRERGTAVIRADRGPSDPHSLLSQVVARLNQLELSNAKALDGAADLIWEAVRAERLIHVAGSGHSTVFTLEAFYRAGGLAQVNPIWHPMLLPLMGARISTIAERLEGIGAELVRLARVREGDVVVVFSQSGVNPVPVEIAQAARSAGAAAIGILSLEHAHAVPSRHRSELRLSDVVDIVIDTGGPVGDASYVASGRARGIAPLSTILGTFAWDSILVRIADLAAECGIELPVWVSANVPDGDAIAAGLASRFHDRISAL
jgi:uncharacterized phosphosugar-binding protein